MKYYHFYIFLLLFSGLSHSLYAQSEGKSQLPAEPNLELELKNAKSIDKSIILPARRAHLYMEPISTAVPSPANLKEPDPQATPKKQLMNCKLLLTVFNPGTIARIHVQLGSAEGQSDVVSQVFYFDQQAEAPFSFTRDGKIVVLGLGRYANTASLYGEVILEDLNGQRSAPKRFGSKG